MYILNEIKAKREVLGALLLSRKETQEEREGGVKHFKISNLFKLDIVLWSSLQLVKDDV